MIYASYYSTDRCQSQDIGGDKYILRERIKLRGLRSIFCRQNMRVKNHELYDK